MMTTCHSNMWNKQTILLECYDIIDNYTHIEFYDDDVMQEFEQRYPDVADELISDVYNSSELREMIEQHKKFIRS